MYRLKKQHKPTKKIPKPPQQPPQNNLPPFQELVKAEANNAMIQDTHFCIFILIRLFADSRWPLVQSVLFKF